MKKSKWTLYYADGSTYSSLDGPAGNSPIKPIVCFGDSVHGWTIHGWDWYYWNHKYKHWWNSTTDGLLYQLMNDKDKNIRHVRPGCLSGLLFEHSINKALEDRTP